MSNQVFAYILLHRRISCCKRKKILQDVVLFHNEEKTVLHFELILYNVVLLQNVSVQASAERTSSYIPAKCIIFDWSFSNNIQL